MHIILFNERQSARGAAKMKSRRWFLLWTQRVRDDAQTGQPKTIRPALSLANIGAQPGFVVINAFLRTKALERSPVLHQAELPMAVSAVIFHNFLYESHLRPLCALSLKKAPCAISTSGIGGWGRGLNIKRCVLKLGRLLTAILLRNLIPRHGCQCL